jgi:thiamine biosynthesis lipoprotein
MTALSRRRFLTITAAALATPAGAVSVDWTGTGMGGALSVRLEGVTPAQALRLQARIGAVVARIEGLFSLHRDSALARLNRDGRLAYPAPDFLALCALAGQVHAATGGRFDPTVQALWQALAQGKDEAAARKRIGWAQVAIRPEEIRLPPGAALTFNGIAQGFAADCVAALLRREGLRHVLIDMGEIATLGPRADGRSWRAAVQGPSGQALAEVALAGRALAVSSVLATRFADGRGHILDPGGGPAVWSTVAVSAPSAALADALSTAFCLMDRRAIARAQSAFAATRCEALVPA